jgi:hypothetical protein
MNRLIAAIGVLLLALVGCGSRDSGSLGTLPTEQPPGAGPSASASPPVPTPEPTGGPVSRPSTSAPIRPSSDPGPASPGRTLTIQVWFTRDGTLFPTSRTRAYTVATSGLALEALAAGPSSPERRAGVRNGVPSDLRYEVTVADDVATVDLPGSFYDGGRDAVRLRQAQVVYSLTQFATVSSVGFQRDGEPAGAPVGRSDYEDLLPPIVVTNLAIGQRVASPVTVAGSANVFEATVSVRILDASGAELATTFTTAACGSGCRGDYQVSVRYRLAAEQRGTVEVYEVSAEDGSRVNVVGIPVTLAPSR